MTGNAFLDLLLIAVPIIGVRLWWTGSRAHELAVQHARSSCLQQQLQFLDQTAALASMKLARTATGATCLEREFRFEFTDQGQYRDAGSVTMQGHVLKRVHIPYTRDTDGNRIYLH